MGSALDLELWGREFEVSHVTSVVSLGRILYSSTVFFRSGMQEREVLNCSQAGEPDCQYECPILSSKIPSLVA